MLVPRRPRNKYPQAGVDPAAFLTLDLIMFGSFARLTDSGPGCPGPAGLLRRHSNPHAPAMEPIHAAGDRAAERASDASPRPGSR
ncbi:hypothetical protein ACTMU2_36405 [Cupriavidus basilensis]